MPRRRRLHLLRRLSLLRLPLSLRPLRLLRLPLSLRRLRLLHRLLRQSR